MDAAPQCVSSLRTVGKLISKQPRCQADSPLGIIGLVVDAMVGNHDWVEVGRVQMYEFSNDRMHVFLIWGRGGGWRWGLAG